MRGVQRYGAMMNCQPPGPASVAEAPAWARSTDPGASAATIPWPAAGPAALPVAGSSNRSRSPPVHGSSARTGEGSHARTMVISPSPAQRHMSRPESFAWSHRSITVLLALGVSGRFRRRDATTTHPSPTCAVWIAWSLCSPLASRPGRVASAPCSPGRSGRRSALACTRPAGKRPRPARPTAAAAGPAAPPAAGSLRIPPQGTTRRQRPPGKRSQPAPSGRIPSAGTPTPHNRSGRSRPAAGSAPAGDRHRAADRLAAERSGRDPRMARSSPLADSPVPDRRVPGSRRTVGRMRPESHSRPVGARIGRCGVSVRRRRRASLLRPGRRPPRTDRLSRPYSRRERAGHQQDYDRRHRCSNLHRSPRFSGRLAGEFGRHGPLLRAHRWAWRCS